MTSTTDIETWTPFFKRVLTSSYQNLFDSKCTQIISYYDPIDDHNICHCQINNSGEVLHKDFVYVESLANFIVFLHNQNSNDLFNICCEINSNYEELTKIK